MDSELIGFSLLYIRFQNWINWERSTWIVPLTNFHSSDSPSRKQLTNNRYIFVLELPVGPYRMLVLELDY